MIDSDSNMTTEQTIDYLYYIERIADNLDSVNVKMVPMSNLTSYMASISSTNASYLGGIGNTLEDGYDEINKSLYAIGQQITDMSMQEQQRTSDEIAERKKMFCSNFRIYMNADRNKIFIYHLMGDEKKYTPNEIADKYKEYDFKVYVSYDSAKKKYYKQLNKTGIIVYDGTDTTISVELYIDDTRVDITRFTKTFELQLSDDTPKQFIQECDLGIRFTLKNIVSKIREWDKKKDDVELSYIIFPNDSLISISYNDFDINNNEYKSASISEEEGELISYTVKRTTITNNFNDIIKDVANIDFGSEKCANYTYVTNDSCYIPEVLDDETINPMHVIPTSANDTPVFNKMDICFVNDSNSNSIVLCNNIEQNNLYDKDDNYYLKYSIKPITPYVDAEFQLNPTFKICPNFTIEQIQLDTFYGTTVNTQQHNMCIDHINYLYYVDGMRHSGTCDYRDIMNNTIRAYLPLNKISCANGSPQLRFDVVYKLLDCELTAKINMNPTSEGAVCAIEIFVKNNYSIRAISFGIYLSDANLVISETGVTVNNADMYPATLTTTLTSGSASSSVNSVVIRYNNEFPEQEESTLVATLVCTGSVNLSNPITITLNNIKLIDVNNNEQDLSDISLLTTTTDSTND